MRPENRVTLESDNASSGFDRAFDLDERGGRPVVTLCNLIIAEALAANASAVNLISTGEGCTVRYNVGDQWHDVMKIPTLAARPLINRIRVMANLDRTKGHTRQEGVLHARSHGTTIVFKVEVEPKPNGLEDAMLHCPQS